MRATRKRDKYCTEEQMKKTFLQSIRTIATLLFLLVGNLLQQMWAADIKYHIINNNGKECFVYVIKGEGKDKTYERTQVTTGLSDGVNIEIKKGVTQKDKVRGPEKINDEDKK